MPDYRIYSKDGTFFGTYRGSTPEDAFNAMVEDGAGNEETAGTVNDWDILLVEDGP